MSVPTGGPTLSVIVVVYNMAREAPRTLRSLAPDYQRDIRADDYEVIVVDNGSTVPFDPGSVTDWGALCRLIRIDSAPVSPALAINRGLAAARGQIVGVLIDGARLVSPGVLHFARCGSQLYPRSIVATLGRYLGADYQAYAAQAGYDARQEDALLDAIAWPNDGYRLFEISTPDESSLDAWFAGPEGWGTVFESNALFARREVWDRIGGADERFASAGGGLLNFDLFKRAMELPEARLVLPLGEATFHQFHGGTSTNEKPEKITAKARRWFEEYRSIRARPYTPPRVDHPPTCIGTLPMGALPQLVHSIVDSKRQHPLRALGAAFDLYTWPERHVRATTHPQLAALTNLMRDAFRVGCYEAVAAIARLARSVAPSDPEPQRVLKLFAQWHDERWQVESRYPANFHLIFGKALLLVNKYEQAAQEFRKALWLDPTMSEARTHLARCVP